MGLAESGLKTRGSGVKISGFFVSSTMLGLTTGDALLEDPGPATTMWCAPAGWAGETAVICVSDTTLKLVATTPPNATRVAPVNPVPVTVTDVPPADGPDDGAIAVIAGAGGL